MAKVTVQLDGDARRLLAQMQRVIDAQTKMALKARESAQASEESAGRTVGGLRRILDAFGGAEDGRKRAFGQQALGELRSFAMQVGGITAAINAAREAFQEFNRTKEEAASRARAAERGLGSLAQLSGGDPAKLRALVDASRSTFSEGGAESLDAAARQVFALESAGVLDSKNRRLFSSLYGIVDDPGQMASSAAALMASLGKEETGSMEQVLSKVLVASGKSPALAERLLLGASRGGGFARTLGVGDEELLAATALTATATGSAEEGGTQVAALLKSLATQGGFKGLSLADSIRKIQGMQGGGVDADAVKASQGRISRLERELADVDLDRSRLDELGMPRGREGQIRRRHRIEDLERRRAEIEGALGEERGNLSGLKSAKGRPMSDDELIKFFGRAEAFRAYSVLSQDLGGLEGLTDEVSAGADSGLIGNVIRARSSIPEVELARRARQASAKKELDETYLGARQNAVEAILSETRGRLAREGRWIERGVFNANRGLAELFGGDFLGLGATDTELLEGRDAGGSFGMDAMGARGGSENVRAMLEELRRISGNQERSRATDLSPKDGDL